MIAAKQESVVDSERQTTVLLIDFDGTMVDTLPTLMRMYMTFLAEHGAQGSEEEFSYLNGRAGHEAIAYLKENHNFPDSIEELTLDYMIKLREFYATDVEFFPGTVEFLRAARAAGLRLAVVSSAGKELVHSVLKRSGADAFVEAVITPENLKRSKPDPAIFLQALQVMGITPSDALVIEDAPNGIRAALAAGIPTIAICREGTPPDMPHSVLATASNWDEVFHLATGQ
jgi:HAD superfamily hydrolase (TIGR01509 family)